MNPPLFRKLAAYAATATALSGSAKGTIVYQDLNDLLLTDPDPAASNGNTDSIGAIRFNGMSVVFNHTSTGGAATFNAIEQIGTGKPPSLATIFASGGYVQTPEILAFGDLIGAAFTQTNTTMNIPAGSGENLFMGISTPTHQYGWVRFSYTETGKTITLHDAAFQSDPNVTIHAGETGQAGMLGTVPEPSAAGLLGLAGGVAALRRRRSALKAC